MKIEIVSPKVPNFVQTNAGTFSLARLSDAEFEEYLTLTIVALRTNRARQQRADDGN